MRRHSVERHPVRVSTYWRGARIALLASSLLAASGVGAQVVSNQPLAPTREEIQRPQAVAPGPATSVVIEGGLERPPCALDNPEFADIRLTLRDVEFAGLGSVDPAIVRPSFAAMVGSEQKVSVVCAIRDRAADLLHDAGYIAAVQVPEQSIADGRIRFTVVLARLTDIRVRGDAGRAEKLIAGYLNRLKAQPVFNRFEAERYLLLASDLPGYSVRLALRPATGGKPGDAVGEVTVARVPFAMDANVQNYGSRELGRIGGQVRAQLFGLTGMGDVTTLSAFATSDFSEQRTLSATHDFRVGAEGLTVMSAASYSWARPDIPGPNTVTARTFVGSLALGYPFVRRQSLKVRGSAGLELINQVIRDDGDALSRDRLRILFARLDHEASSSDFSRAGYSVEEPVWRTAISVELRHGIGILGATNRCGTVCVTAGGIPLSRDGADPTAGLVRGSLYGEYRPAPKFTIAVGARAQYASKSLASYEQFAAGNYSIGRGYDPGTLLGDRGIAGQIEIRGGSLLAASARKVAAQPFLFFDAARVGNDQGSFLPRGQRDLTSLGAGVRASWQGFGIETMVAVPLKRTGFNNEKPDPRLLFSISRRLWPWGG